MLIRFSMVFLTMVLAVLALLLAAKHPTGPNTVTFDEPVGLLISLGMLLALFFPPFILSFFNNLVVKIISAIYQFFIVVTFLILVPVGFFVPSFSIMVIGVLGAIVSIGSIIATIFAGLKKNDRTT